MATNQNPEEFNISHTSLDPQLKLLMSLRNFDNDLDIYCKRFLDATNELTSTYEMGASILEQYGDPAYKKEWEELLNEIHVHCNQLNQSLSFAKEQTKNRENFDFSTHWKSFESRLNDLKNASQKFENLGVKLLPENKKQGWENEIGLYENKIEPILNQNAKAAKLILQFMFKYSPEGLDRMVEIINDNVPENAENMDPKDYEASYLKAFREFQKEFKPQNLWDNFLEILAGGVHPSPSERVMLEKWVDGEDKTRQDM